MSYPSDKLTIDEYQKLSYRTAPKSYKELTHKQFELLHAVLGLTTEVGEIASAVKKHIIYRQPLDETNIIEEEGDLDWYIALLATAIKSTRSIALERNIEKLKRRYPQGFTEQAAAERADKAGSGKTLNMIGTLVRGDDRQFTIEHILRGVYGSAFKQISATLKDDVTTVLKYEAPHSDVQKRAVIKALEHCKYTVGINYGRNLYTEDTAVITVEFLEDQTDSNELLPTEQQEDYLRKRGEYMRKLVMQIFGDTARVIRIDDANDAFTWLVPHDTGNTRVRSVINVLESSEYDCTIEYVRKLDTELGQLTVKFTHNDQTEEENNVRAVDLSKELRPGL